MKKTEDKFTYVMICVGIAVLLVSLFGLWCNAKTSKKTNAVPIGLTVPTKAIFESGDYFGFVTLENAEPIEVLLPPKQRSDGLEDLVIRHRIFKPKETVLVDLSNPTANMSVIGSRGNKFLVLFTASRIPPGFVRDHAPSTSEFCVEPEVMLKHGAEYLANKYTAQSP